MYTKDQLIELGYAPTAARAKMKHPFMLPIGCPAHHYNNLPADIQAKYEADSVRPTGQRMLLRSTK